MVKEKVLDVPEAAQSLGLSSYYVRVLLREGDLEGFKIKSKWRIKQSAIDKFIKSRMNTRNN